MNSRERINNALRFKDPDRVPIDFNGHRSSGIHVKAYERLRNYLQLPPSPLYIYDFIQQLAIVEEDVLEILGSDVLQLGCDFNLRHDYWKDWIMHDGTKTKIPAFIDVRLEDDGYVIYNSLGKPTGIQKFSCLYFEQTNFPLADDFEKDSFDDLSAINEDVMWMHVPCPPMPIDLKSPDGKRAFKKIAAKTRDSTDRAIYGIFGGNLVEVGQYTFRIDNFLCELLAEPERIHNYLDTLLAMHMENLENYLDSVGEHLDVIGFGDDMGTQTGPQFSTDVYEEFFKPRHKKMWDYVHERFPELKICLHCCGAVRPLLPHLIEAGLDAINPVQFNCTGMDLTELKNEFNGKLVFWGGGCDTRDILPKGSPQDIAKHVAECVKIMKPGGGFVFQQVHNIMADVPPENIVAMFKAI